MMMNFMGNPYGKVCTFTRSLQGMQLFTYCLIATQLILFLAGIQANYVSSTYRITMMVLILVTFCVMVITCFKVSSIDPVDTVLLQYRNGDPKKIESEITSCLYCDSCNSYVKNTSKHCKLCDRCVDKFDHHCTWVNNCIGADNYKWFIGMIISAFLFKLFFLVAVGLIYQQQNWNNFIPAMVIAWILFAVTLPLTFMLFALVCFHMMLISKGITTFEFIMMQREQDQVKMTAQEEGQAKPEDINRTDQNITGLGKEGQTTQQLQFKGSIFQESSEEYSQKREFKKIEQSTNNKVSKTNQTQTIEQKDSNQQEMKEFFGRHKSLKFLVGQSLVIQEYRSNNYHSLRQRQVQTDMRKGRQKAYDSTKNRQGK